MRTAFLKDIWRTIRNTKKRFVCIALIVILGVTMMCGLRAGCIDLRKSADTFFDEQNLFDIQILSTLGLTEADVEALDSLEIIACAEGGYNETVYIEEDGMRKTVEIRSLSEKEMNLPYVLEGRLPEAEDEIVITENYASQTGKGLGDRIEIESSSEQLKAQKFIITGIMIDPLDVNSSEGAMGFRSTASTDYVGYILPEAAEYEVYTVLYLQVKGAKALNCYSEEYEEKIGQIVDLIETEIKAQREQARYEEVYGEALDAWKSGESEMNEAFAEAEAELADAQLELSEGWQELWEGQQEIASGKQEIASGTEELKEQEALAEQEFAKARQEIASGYEQLEAGKQELEEAYAQLVEGQAQLDAGREELEAQQEQILGPLEQAYGKLTERQTAADANYAAETQKIAATEQTIAGLNEQLADDSLSASQKWELQKQLTAAKLEQADAKIRLAAAESEQKLIASSKKLLEQQISAVEEQFAPYWEQIEEGQQELDLGWAQYEEGLEQWRASEEQLKAGEAELAKQEASAREQIAQGKQELIEGSKQLEAAEAQLRDGEAQLEEGEALLAANVEKYEEEKEKAEQELEEARQKIEEIDVTKWYVQDRFSLSGCANVKSDANSIQALGELFPILFLIVSVLISLTTITRMVEEERGLIGTYKALGFSNRQIRRKYIVYAALAALLGGIIGDIGGYVIIPSILFLVFKVMYNIPEYFLQFDIWYGFGGVLFFMAGILIATIVACQNALKKTPAHLMRPKAPKAGMRVLLEKMPFLWKRMSFLNKVTARNLFRYKKRLFMTLFGIAGCTALLLCGFTIKDTVSELMPQQYHEIYQYDVMAVVSAEDYDALLERFENDEEVQDFAGVQIESVEMIREDGKKETIQLVVVPEGDMLKDYICLRDVNKEIHVLQDGEVYVSKNAMRILEYQEGECVTIQNLDLEEAQIEVTRIVENYLGNMMYMTERTYQEFFGTCEYNGALVHLTDECEDHGRYTEQLSREEGVLSASSTQEMEAEFGPSFVLINMVVYLILILAAMLAFVVLFTLANTNISERERELATIKVLGFYHPEVHSYVNKETFLLTILGILFGMPTGWILGYALMSSLKFSSLEFYVVMYPVSYVYAGVITLFFAVVVSLITNKILDRIDMVEALKSVE